MNARQEMSTGVVWAWIAAGLVGFWLGIPSLIVWLT